MQLTTFTDYSLRSLLYLAASSPNTATVKEISDYYQISQNHLIKVIHRLSQLKYIETTRGRKGGLKINEEVYNFYLGDLIINFEPNMTMVECFNPETNQCKLTEFCQLKHYLKEAHQSFIETLNKYTFADLTKNIGLFPKITMMSDHQ